MPAEAVLVHRGLSELPMGLRMALTVGVFDGMHRGHLSLLAATVREARAWDATPVAVTLHGAACFVRFTRDLDSDTVSAKAAFAVELSRDGDPAAEPARDEFQHRSGGGGGDVA